MANGGWYGTQEEWARLQKPLESIDPVLEAFAISHGLELLKNTKDSPERSLRWGENPSFLIQIYLEDEVRPSWNLWLCCYEDRDNGRYWSRDFAIQDEPVDSFGSGLRALLEESFDRLEEWGSHPDQLEFATKLAPRPRL